MLTRTLKFIRPSPEYRELTLLTEIGTNPAGSQRTMARAAMVSPAMVNDYVEKLINGGLVKVQGNTNRSIRYHLTDAGRGRRDDLFFRVSREIIQFYGRMKGEFQRRLEGHRAAGVRSVVLFGAAETAELVFLAARQAGLWIVGVVDNDPAKHGQDIGGVKITPPDAIEALRPDAVIITSFGHMDEIYGQVKHLEDRGIRILRL